MKERNRRVEICFSSFLFERIFDALARPTFLFFQMSLWCDKYRPKTFDELDFQLDQAALLQTIVASGDFPHFLIFGPSGAGKKTRISCLLQALYGDGVQSLRIENHEYETPSRKKIEITTIGSNFHVQVNPR